MKKLNKKEWGIVSTSIGSILIMVALLTMVGIGSNDTYAANTVTVRCTCPDGYNWITGTAKCTKTAHEEYQCCTGISCKEHTGGLEYCSSTEECTETSNEEVGLGSTKHTVYVYSCSKGTTTSADCTCANGTPDDTGECQSTSAFYCEPGTYHRDTRFCIACPDGYWCPGGNFEYYGQMQGMYECPENADCTASSFTCKDGYKQSGNYCVKDQTCPAGEYIAAGECVPCTQGSYCPGNGTIVTCPVDRPKSKANSTSEDDCKTGDSPSDTTIKCDEGWYYTGEGTCKICPANSYCPGGTYLKSDKNRYGGVKCPDDRPYSNEGAKSVNDCKASGGDPNTPGGGDSSTPGGGDSSTPGGGDSSTPGGGDSSTPGGGDSSTPGGGDSGGNGNANQNPNTATKTPLVIAIIGTMSMVLGTFAYFKGKKEINTEI